MKSILLWIYSLTTWSKMMLKYIHRALAFQLWGVRVCDVRMRNMSGLSSLRQLAEITTSPLRNAFLLSDRLNGRLHHCARTHRGLDPTSSEQHEDKKEERHDATLMDKERVCFCVQTFNRVTEGPVVLEICRGKVESQTVNYDYSHFGQLPARVQVSK